MAPTISVSSIRRVAALLGALGLLIPIGVIWSDRFMAMGSAQTISVREAWSAGLIQGFFILNLVLALAAVGVWLLRSWARWLALAWFPLLAANNIATELWHTHSVQPDSWFQATVLSVLWVGSLYRFLAGQQAAVIFHGAKV
ncbi:MAG: hypothetical protein HYV17_06755 [Xanthomonadales bacterium]|nr:hypothetical protein [Xanthomonadales bacterium]